MDIIKHRNFLLSEITLGNAKKYIDTLSPSTVDNNIYVAKDFIRFQPSLNKKDLYQYKDYEELQKSLEQASNSKNQKRIKVGKLDPQDKKDPNLIFDDNNIRVYKAHNKKDSIKYGKDTNLCIATRGENEFDSISKYGNTFFYIFNDNPSSTYDILVLNINHNDKNPYKIYLKNNNICGGGPKWEGNWSIVEKIIPELIGKESIFDNNLRKFNIKQQINALQIDLLLKFSNMDKELFSPIISKYLKYNKYSSNTIFQNYDIKKIKNSINIINNIIENKKNLYLLEFKGGTFDGQIIDGFEVDSSTFFNNKDEAINYFKKGNFKKGIEDKKLTNLKEISYHQIEKELLYYLNQLKMGLTKLKNILSPLNEILRMQYIAGIINEIKINNPLSLRSENLLQLLCNYYDEDPDFFEDIGISSKEVLRGHYGNNIDSLIMELISLGIDDELDNFYNKNNKIIIDNNDFTKNYKEYKGLQ